MTTKYYMVQKRSMRKPQPGERALELWDDLGQTTDKSEADNLAAKHGKNGRVVELHHLLDRNYELMDAQLIAAVVGLGIAGLVAWAGYIEAAIVIAMIGPVIAAGWFWIDAYRSQSRRKP